MVKLDHSFIVTTSSVGSILITYFRCTEISSQTRPPSSLSGAFENIDHKVGMGKKFKLVFREQKGGKRHLMNNSKCFEIACQLKFLIMRYFSLHFCLAIATHTQMHLEKY